MKPPPHRHDLGAAPSSRPLLDLNAEPMEVELPPAPAAAPRRQPETSSFVTAQRIFHEFSFRRAALVRAITTDGEEFYRRCDPNLQEMCLYGHTDGSWEVREPEQEVPTDQPEPTLGLNLVRDSMERPNWLQKVAMHSDSWLTRVSFFIGGRLLNATGREYLFNSINSLSTVHEELLASETYHRLCPENEERPGGAIEDEGVEDEDNSEEDDFEEIQDDDDYFCGICGARYHKNGFWISCDGCRGWFHGRCVNITQEQANNLEHFLCPECGYDNNGHDFD